MRTGFACIFSDPPGTGKTETVYQIARKTDRDIMLVNIAETKSMWFGESEKLIKSVFDRYRGIVSFTKPNLKSPMPKQKEYLAKLYPHP
jgi:SpoVK/Ycf46/Vps4 family AAA+-type ATPase